MKVELNLTHQLNRTVRIRQLEAMFDVPVYEKLHVELDGEMPIEERDWSVGLIVGPSGCGKTQILNHYFGGQKPYSWQMDSMIDDFSKDLTMDDICTALSAVGFNTIPAWMRPFKILSNGEQFRAGLARHLLEDQPTVVVDEFTSVVDRQVAQIGAAACQKFIRRRPGKKFVAASCHYDIIDWLDPDWVFEPATKSFTWRVLRGRPRIQVTVSRTTYEMWHLFAPFHYMTAELNHAARCYTLFVGDAPAAFGGVLYRPHPKVTNVYGLSRLVTLPDFQGLGLALVLAERLGAIYQADGKQFHTYPVHPALVRAFAKRPDLWSLQKKPGDFSPRKGSTGSVDGFGGRRCAVFSYIGPPLEDAGTARRLLFGA